MTESFSLLCSPMSVLSNTVIKRVISKLRMFEKMYWKLNWFVTALSCSNLGNHRIIILKSILHLYDMTSTSCLLLLNLILFHSLSLFIHTNCLSRLLTDSTCPSYLVIVKFSKTFSSLISFVLEKAQRFLSDCKYMFPEYY